MDFLIEAAALGTGISWLCRPAFRPPAIPVRIVGRWSRGIPLFLADTVTVAALAAHGT
jgi:hypothetical protein